MTTYTYPSTANFALGSFEIGLREAVLVSSGTLSGAIQTQELPGARWVASLGYERQGAAERAEVEAFWNRLQGQINRVALWHLVHPAPRGTMRGTPVLASDVAIRATVATITTTPGATVFSGDMLGIGGRLVKVVGDATADGAGALLVNFAPCLPDGAAAGSAVVWDKPTATFMSTAPVIMIPYRDHYGAEFGVDLVEV